MKTLIKNIEAVVSGRLIKTDLAFENGIFCSPEGNGKEIDGTNLIAIPGFIDTHIHGIGGFGTEDGTAEAIL